jgi:eukaryotic translation initiation factor 2C
MLWRLQPPRMEIIAELEEIMKDQLLFFYRMTKQKPEAILFYRDGVSEGQFKQVQFFLFIVTYKACSDILGFLWMVHWSLLITLQFFWY